MTWLLSVSLEAVRFVALGEWIVLPTREMSLQRAEKECGYTE